MRGRHPYTWGKDHPLVVDGLLVVLLAAFGIATEVAAPADAAYRASDDLSGMLTLASTLPLVLRRRFPLAVFIAVVVAATFYLSREYPGAGPLLAWLVALYGVAAYVRRRTAVICLVATLAVVELGTLTSTDYGGVAELIGVGAVIVTAWVLGDNMRVRRAYVAAVEDRAAQLEREQDAQARRAVLEERSSIARELHDVVAHSMSVMVVQAGAARRTLARDRARAVEAIGHIESTGRSALAEMRRLVGVLRSDVEPAAPGAGAHGDHDEASPPPPGEPAERPALLPQPGIDQVPDLVGQCREAGLDVALQVEGAQRPLPSGVELVVYRIVQEALTNTMRHAGPARAEVALCYGDDVVTVTVTDDGRGAANDADLLVVVNRGRLATVSRPADGEIPAPGPGHGLTGMRERVALYGGRIDVGPRPGGGFRVWAEIPLSDPNGAARVGGGGVAP